MKNRELTFYERKIKENLELLFKKNRQKKADLAIVLHTSPTSVTRFCKGISTPTIDQLVLNCSFFNININELIGISNDNDLSIDERNIIRALKDDPISMRYVKRILEID